MFKFMSKKIRSVASIDPNKSKYISNFVSNYSQNFKAPTFDSSKTLSTSNFKLSQKTNQPITTHLLHLFHSNVIKQFRTSGTNLFNNNATPTPVPEYIEKLRSGDIAFRGIAAVHANDTPLAPAHRGKTEEEIARLPRNASVSPEEAERHAKNQLLKSEILSLTSNMGVANDIANPPNEKGVIDPNQGVVQIIDRQGLTHRAGDMGQSELVVKHLIDRSRVLGHMSYEVAKAFTKAWKATPEAQSRLEAAKQLKEQQNRRRGYF